MKRLIAAFLAGAMVHAASSRAATCICPPEAVDPAWAVHRATVVFLGGVQQTTPDRKVVNAIGQSQTQYVATFTVERQWQGSDVQKIDVVTVRGGFCGPNFEVGKQYVVFAFKGVARRISFDALTSKAANLEARYGLPFTRYVNRLRAMNPCTPQELIVAG